MIDNLIKHISEKISLTKDEIEICRNTFIPKKLKRRQFLLQSGDVCKYVAFIDSGCLKTYSANDKGEEHILQIAIEDWWATDMYSFLTGDISNLNIEALEDSTLLLQDREGREKLAQQIPKFEKLMRVQLENNFIATQRRINSMLSKSAEERYNEFIIRYPKIVARVPQHMIASYLGVKPETISRIRKTIASK